MDSTETIRIEIEATSSFKTIAVIFFFQGKENVEIHSEWRKKMLNFATEVIEVGIPLNEVEVRLPCVSVVRLQSKD